MLDTNSHYKSTHLVHTWTRENYGVPLCNIVMNIGECFHLILNAPEDEKNYCVTLKGSYIQSTWRTSLAIVNLSKLAFRSLISKQQALQIAVSRFYFSLILQNQSSSSENNLINEEHRDKLDRILGSAIFENGAEKENFDFIDFQADLTNATEEELALQYEGHILQLIGINDAVVKELLDKYVEAL